MCDQTDISQSRTPSVILENGSFRAVVVPGVGGNAVSLRHIPSGTKLLREPSGPEELRKYPEQFGLPVLFPPNRIEDGEFEFEGRVCRLPVNETAMKNHLHGLAVGKAWETVRQDGCSIEEQFVFSRECPEYGGFPFAFTLKRVLRLTEQGLADRVTVCNDGDRAMPLGLGFHSTFPAKGARVRLGAGAERIEIGERYLPTGRRVPWEGLDPRNWFVPEGIDAGFHTRAETMACEDGTALHGAEICYESGLLRYVTDEKFGFWYTWNRRGEGDFISLEPVSWMSNALNQDGGTEETGVRVLPGGMESEFCCELKFYAEWAKK